MSPVADRWYMRPEEEEEHEPEIVYERMPLGRYVSLALQIAFWLLCIGAVLYAVGPMLAAVVVLLTIAYRLR